MMKKIVFVLLLLTSLFRVMGQTQTQTDEQLGIRYFQNKEYEKAVQIFEKVYNKKGSSYIYYYYCQSLIELKDYKEAEKLIKKQQKLQPNVQSYKVDLGYIYELSNEQAKAQKEYENTIKDLSANDKVIKELYNAFMAKRLYEYAIQTLQRGRKLLNNNKMFSTELTRIYTQLNQTEKVIDEALSLVADNEVGYLTQAEAILQNVLVDDENDQHYMTIKTILQRNIQKYPNNNCYFSLLYWVYRLNKDYVSALTLAKSIDKREKEDGKTLFALAKEAAGNRDYDVAIEALETIIAKGEKSGYYTDAKFEMLNVKYIKLTSAYPIKMLEAVSLEKEFKKALNEYGLHSGTSEWVRKYAHLLAFYVNKPQEAVDLLNEVIANTTREPREKALYKTDLADIELYRGNVWDATLLYSQVDKDFPNDTIGQLAKYKNAKLSFYIGEFNWAKSQLDVLRAATSKLIANDAMYFSLLISDNEAEEEEEEEAEEDLSLFSNQGVKNQPLLYYAKADFLRFQNRDDEALKMLDSVIYIAPYGSLADDVLFQKAEIAIRQGNYLGAEELLLQLLKSHGNDILGDDATFLLAELYEYYLKDIPSAMEYYQKLLKDYPGSLYVVKARKQFRSLRGDNI